MRYKITMEENQGDWVYVISLGKETPSDTVACTAYSTNNVSAEDMYGTRHYVYFKEDKIVQIRLFQMRQILPQFDPDRPETIQMPGMHAVNFGNPPQPTLLMVFKNEAPTDRTLYALSPNVFLAFINGELAQLYVTDVYNVLNDVE